MELSLGKGLVWNWPSFHLPSPRQSRPGAVAEKVHMYVFVGVGFSSVFVYF